MIRMRIFVGVQHSVTCNLLLNRNDAGLSSDNRQAPDFQTVFFKTKPVSEVSSKGTV